MCTSGNRYYDLKVNDRTCRRKSSRIQRLTGQSILLGYEARLVAPIVAPRDDALVLDGQLDIVYGPQGRVVSLYTMAVQ